MVGQLIFTMVKHGYHYQKYHIRRNYKNIVNGVNVCQKIDHYGLLRIHDSIPILVDHFPFSCDTIILPLATSSIVLEFNFGALRGRFKVTTSVGADQLACLGDGILIAVGWRALV
jgi:hypothetical protein